MDAQNQFKSSKLLNKDMQKVKKLKKKSKILINDLLQVQNEPFNRKELFLGHRLTTLKFKILCARIKLPFQAFRHVYHTAQLYDIPFSRNKEADMRWQLNVKFLSSVIQCITHQNRLHSGASLRGIYP